MFNLSGKVALVTGASRGIGRACAIRLGALGARVIVNFNKSATAADDVIALIKAGGGEATAVQGDVSRFATAQAVVRAAIRPTRAPRDGRGGRGRTEAPSPGRQRG